MPKHKHADETVVDENTAETVEETQGDNAPDESEYNFDDDTAPDESGIPTLTVGKLVIKAPNKYLPGHVMTEDEAEHYSNFVRSRCASNMISMEKRNNKVWTAESAAEYYEAYVLGAPRSRIPDDEKILDEALDALLDELSAAKGQPLPKGRQPVGMPSAKEQIAAIKAAVLKLPDYAPRIAALVAEIKADYAAKAAAKVESSGTTEARPSVLTVDSLFA